MGLEFVHSINTFSFSESSFFSSLGGRSLPPAFNYPSKASAALSNAPPSISMREQVPVNIKRHADIAVTKALLH
jgi:hypothetical protein